MFTILSILIFTIIIALIKIKRFLNKNNSLARLGTQKKVCSCGHFANATLCRSALFNCPTSPIDSSNSLLNAARLRTQKKVAILGKLPSKFWAPFDDKNFEIWTMNYHDRPLPRVDLWFDIHCHNPNPKANITRKNYPFEEAQELLEGNYFNNTVSYMIAYAILKGYKTIYLYGMNFNKDNDRRFSEFQNVRELIFFAKGKGIKIIAPTDEIMTRDYRKYGVK